MFVIINSEYKTGCFNQIHSKRRAENYHTHEFRLTAKPCHVFKNSLINDLLPSFKVDRLSNKILNQGGIYFQKIKNNHTKSIFKFKN